MSPGIFMSTALLSTKLFIPPTRPVLVPRLRLVEQLNQGLHRKLTLISTPAGFGKTTLTAEWLQKIGEPAAWVSLEERDNI
jgi:LuxR family maltose regulon positive regulatory protein